MNIYEKHTFIKQRMIICLYFITVCTVGGLRYWEPDNVENAEEFYPAWYAYCLPAKCAWRKKASSGYNISVK